MIIYVGLWLIMITASENQEHRNIVVGDSSIVESQWKWHELRVELTTIKNKVINWPREPWQPWQQRIQLQWYSTK